MTCILAFPQDGTIYADVGLYDDKKAPPDPEVMIRNEKFVLWGGVAARYWVPTDYYLQYMPEESGGQEKYNEQFGRFSHFVFFENRDSHLNRYKSEEVPVWVDHENCLYVSWLCLLYGDGFQWFDKVAHAQGFFLWLTALDIQELIYDASKFEGSKFTRSIPTQII